MSLVSGVPEGSQAADNVDPGDTSYPPLLLRHEENLLPLLRHAYGVHRDLLEFVRLNVRVQRGVNLMRPEGRAITCGSQRKGWKTI